jgi:segregation and condensation protein B
MPNATLSVTLEAILFYKGGSVSIKELMSATKKTRDEVIAALDTLEAGLTGRGVRLVREGESAALATSPEAREAIEAMRRDELEGPLGRAGLETLAIVLYRGPVSRADIEYIRGVNVSSILRTLMIRGLIERIDNPKDKRSFLYRATNDLPAYLGVSRLAELPEFAHVTTELEAVLAEKVAAPEEIVVED